MRVIHDLGRSSGPKFVALTNGSIGAHAVTAENLADALGLSRGARRQPPITQPGAASTDTHVRHLTDVLWRREGRLWDADAGESLVQEKADAMAREMGWDSARTAEEILHYKAELERTRYGRD